MCIIWLMIKEESIERLLSIVDIVEVVERYVPLKRSGRNSVGICPFHDDRNPSMSVNSQMGIFHCFSCKAGGNAIKFIMEYEKISYPEAIEKLAASVGFTLEYENNHFGETKKESKKILELLNGYYQNLLYSNQEALNYLYSRGITDELIRKFGIGWAPASQNTIRLLENEEIEPSEALNVGAIKQNERGFYASFTERITFPICNHTGRLVGFGGRTISNHPAKYVNSPQCSVFDKSRIFYAFDLAKKSAYDKKELIITEGYMDVIMLHKAGFTNAVAVLGTALTELHLPLIKRGNFKVILSFDGDSAGINAAVKSAKLLSTNGIDSGVVIIQDGLDPADMVFRGEIKKLKEIYANSVESGEFLIRNIVKNYDILRPIVKNQALNEIIAYTNTLNPIVAGSYQDLVANLLKIPINSFRLTKNSQQNTNFSEFKNEKTQNSVQNGAFSRQKDINELQILKSMVLNKDYLQLFYDYGENDDFKAHKDLLGIVLSGDENDENKAIFRNLALDENILEFSEDDKFIMALKILRENRYRDEIEILKRSDDPDKLSKIMKLENLIRALKSKKLR
ncbi:DNA primase [Campylobacter sp. CS_ED1]|uniref:DNA primase n=2 Tax=unclassified Campylobacter TaxID=2593542 RepID=UPI0022E9A8C0|nr:MULTISPECIES: DNA primase [unclassified Campylobacter]MDA3079387.1 DNA primase [Campylobacter sp. CS_NA2]MDA3085731.1 DNA primase [Campylobacter sp. CS_ED1]MDA3090221.1 DNA primase [Campylobacter sp. CS_ED2]WBR50994.1 DNA primase [Campylobacter sp. CS_NA3]